MLSTLSTILLLIFYYHLYNQLNRDQVVRQGSRQKLSEPPNSTGGRTDAKTKFQEDLPLWELGRLPPDILFIIAGYSNRKTRLHLSFVSKTLHEVAARSLYRNVNLGVHNTDSAIYLGTIDPQAIPYLIIRKQESFLRTIYERPEFADHVRGLSWTILPVGSAYKRDEKFRHTPPWFRSHDGTWNPLSEAYDILRRLRNLQHLDLGQLTGHQRRNLTVTGNRFQSQELRLKSLALHGHLEPTLVGRFGSNVVADNLTSLSITNYLPRRETLEEIRSAIVRKYVQVPLYDYQWLKDQRGLQTEITRSMWAERSQIRPLLLTLKSLKHLTFRMAGTRYWGEVTWLRQIAMNTNLNLFEDLLKANIAHLETLIFEQGPIRKLSHGKSVRSCRTMDTLFGERIYPVLIGGPVWKKLRRLELRGIGDWHWDGNFVPAEEQGSQYPMWGVCYQEIKIAIKYDAYLLVTPKSRTFDYVDILDT